MARKRTVSDKDLLAATFDVLHRLGPAGLTFAAVADATGLSPATLVQRFGSKQALLQAALMQAWDDLDARTRAADADCAPTPQGAIDLLLALSDHGDGDQFAEGFLVLHEDMREPALRARGQAWGEALSRALGRRLAADPARALQLGRLMASQWQGALIWWGFARTQTLGQFVAGELAAFVAVVVDEA